MTLRILHFADIERIFDYPDRIARLSGLIRKYRNEDTIVVGAGDNTAPGALSLMMGGHQVIPFFSLLDVDADTFGNHEFDFGIEATSRLVSESPDVWVCANIFNGEEGSGESPDYVELIRQN